jgi:hypothetical protein
MPSAADIVVVVDCVELRCGVGWLVGCGSVVMMMHEGTRCSQFASLLLRAFHRKRNAFATAMI